MDPATRIASSTDRAFPDRGTGSPAPTMVRWKPLRSSARWMASGLAPIRRTPRRSSSPDSASSTATFSPVCPPIVGRIASGRSRSMTESIDSCVSGSR